MVTSSFIKLLSYKSNGILQLVNILVVLLSNVPGVIVENDDIQNIDTVEWGQYKNLGGMMTAYYKKRDYKKRDHKSKKKIF